MWARCHKYKPSHLSYGYLTQRTSLVLVHTHTHIHEHKRRQFSMASKKTTVPRLPSWRALLLSCTGMISAARYLKEKGPEEEHLPRPTVPEVPKMPELPHLVVSEVPKVPENAAPHHSKDARAATPYRSRATKA